MSIKVLEASAGSGKTFQLSMFYVKLALESPENFKRIVAITFTNAAVNEMKTRILDRLYNLSVKKPGSLEEFIAFANDSNINGKPISQLTEDDISSAAKNVLFNILHNYQDFNVSTIDSFLQKLFRGALYEIGIRYNYELIVKNDEIYEDAVDDFTMSLQKEDQAFDWLVKFIEDKLSDNKSFNYNKLLNELTREINKEFFNDYEENFNKIYDEDFKNLYSDLYREMDVFLCKANKINSEFNRVLKDKGYEEENFAYKGDGSVKYIGSKLENAIKSKDSFKDIFPGSRFLNIIGGNQSLDSNKFKIDQTTQDKIKELMQEFNDLMNSDEYKNYITARIISKQIHNVALLSHILQKLNIYKKTNNILLLSDIGRMLKTFIHENYMFIYEKLGVYYEYFLIDEFQDTSRVQYEIIKPLIDESISATDEESVLLVGDIKQAIYRWRNGDWGIMKDTVDIDFSNRISRKTLKDNWRSYPNIIAFNNSLFDKLLHLNDLFNDTDNNKLDYIKEIYIDPQKDRSVKQEIPINKKDKFGNFKGNVKLYVKKDTNKDNEEDTNVLDIMRKDIEQLWEKNYKNIGILVRSNKEAAVIFKYLLENPPTKSDDFKIISQESITYANSDAVLWIVFTLYWLQNGSKYAGYMSKAFYENIKNGNLISYDNIINNLCKDENILAQNLYFKAEHLVNTIYSQLSEREQTFCIHFLQLIKNYQQEKSNNEVMFIHWFLNKGIKESVKISENENGVHIISIHRSKGLEYDAVIVPYVNWTKNLSDYMWFQKPNFLNNSKVPAFLLKANEELSKSHFAEEYLLEKTKKNVDDLNLLYVAFTRAKKVLIANIENKCIGKEVLKCINNDFDIETLGLLSSYKSTTPVKDYDVYEIGELVNNDCNNDSNDISQFDWKAKENIKIKIKIKQNYGLSTREHIAYGVLIHDIFRAIDDINKWEEKADKILKKHHKTIDDSEKIKTKIRNIFNENPSVIDWFTKAEEIVSERDLAHDGKMLRPDKVFIHTDKIVLVDFKTGDKDLIDYKNQIKKYIEILQQTSNKNIEGYLLNIDRNELLKVEI